MSFFAPTMAVSVIAARVGVVVGALAIWFVTQWLLGRRAARVTGGGAGSGIGDGLHRLTARTHRRLMGRPRLANALLISSSLVIDVLGISLIVVSVVGPTIEPFLGLMMVFALRQVCQALCPLPPPPDMIWRKPGFPTLLVTYGVSNDLFFSGHTAIAVYGAATLAGMLGPWGVGLGVAIVCFEVWAVLVLRAHYTMDVFAGAVTALYVHRLAIDWAPGVDGWISRLATGGM